MALQVNSIEFKAVMSKWPTGVAIVSTKYNDRLFALTVNSFTSVSLTPPLISFCLNKNSGSFMAFHETQSFAVNILAENQAELARNFATKKLDKFLDIKYQEGKFSAAPLIEGAVCFLECAKLYEYAGGDHMILVAKVEHCAVNTTLRPLLYFARKYKQIQ